MMKNVGKNALKNVRKLIIENLLKGLIDRKSDDTKHQKLIN